MTILIVSTILSYLIAGFLGFITSKKTRIKSRPANWILLIVLTLLSQWVLPSTRIIAIFQLEMYANELLQGFFAGMLLGLLFGEKTLPATAV
jgi:hypothetical protein